MDEEGWSGPAKTRLLGEGATSRLKLSSRNRRQQTHERPFFHTVLHYHYFWLHKTIELAFIPLPELNWVLPDSYLQIYWPRRKHTCIHDPLFTTTPLRLSCIRHSLTRLQSLNTSASLSRTPKSFCKAVILPCGYSVRPPQNNRVATQTHPGLF